MALAPGATPTEGAEAMLPAARKCSECGAAGTSEHAKKDGRLCIVDFSHAERECALCETCASARMCPLLPNWFCPKCSEIDGMACELMPNPMCPYGENWPRCRRLLRRMSAGSGWRVAEAVLVEAEDEGRVDIGRGSPEEREARKHEVMALALRLWPEMFCAAITDGADPLDRSMLLELASAAMQTTLSEADADGVLRGLEALSPSVRRDLDRRREARARRTERQAAEAQRGKRCWDGARDTPHRARPRR